MGKEYRGDIKNEIGDTLRNFVKRVKIS